jgi:Flp pilus assembly protein TadG
VSRRPTARRRGESGVFAILYGVLVLVILGVAATVVDLALMREGRASTRSAADSAAVSAASLLNAIDSSKSDPRAACLKAWKYLREGISDLGDGSSSCNVLPVAPAAASCSASTAATVAAWTGGGYTVRVTWPVLASSALMTKPDVAPGSFTQPADPTFDGDDACDRIGVQVARASSTVFAAALGVGDVTISSSSVGRAIEKGESKDVIAALNILEQSKCAALVTSGQGSVLVNGVGDQAGFVAVESSGRDTGNTCNGQGATIEAASNSLNFIRADGPEGPGTGLIQAFALNQPPTGNPAKAYNSGPIQPTPTLLTDRYGARPVLDIFNCTTATCAPNGDDYVDQLEAMYGGTGMPTQVWPTSPEAGLFKTLTTVDAPGFTCDGNASTPAIVVPAGNWYVDCPNGFKVAGLVAFRGGHVVTSGPVELGSSEACLAVNVPVDPAAPVCPTVDTSTTPDTTSPAPSSDSVLFIRTGRLYKVSQAKLYLPRTFTYLQNGYTDLAGGSGALLMTTPLADLSCGTDDACRNPYFRRLVLWSESPDLHAIGGQSALVLRGVLFTPNAPSTFTGQAGQQQADAQFWTRTLEVKGQGTLVMAADPEASISRPLLGVSLIR